MHTWFLYLQMAHWIGVMRNNQGKAARYYLYYFINIYKRKKGLMSGILMTFADQATE